MSVVVGIDEVGRGSWAGPLVVGAVILDAPLPGLKDSKLLSRSQRSRLAHDIKTYAQAIGLGWVEPSELDELGMSQSLVIATERALAQIKVPYEQIIIDGHINFLKANPKARAVIKADSLVYSVSAASIIAKVARDEYMIKLALDFPNYGFEKHVGYGTALHKESLMLHGACIHHRQSFKPIKALEAA